MSVALTRYYWCCTPPIHLQNLGLYAERVGAMSFVLADSDAAQRVLSQLKRLARAIYSNPPVHGARIVSEVVGSEEMFGEWKGEMEMMAGRIKVRFCGWLLAGMLAGGHDSGCYSDCCVVVSRRPQGSLDGLLGCYALRWHVHWLRVPHFSQSGCSWLAPGTAAYSA